MHGAIRPLGRRDVSKPLEGDRRSLGPGQADKLPVLVRNHRVQGVGSQACIVDVYLGNHDVQTKESMGAILPWLVYGSLKRSRESRRNPPSEPPIVEAVKMHEPSVHAVMVYLPE